MFYATNQINDSKWAKVVNENRTLVKAVLMPVTDFLGTYLEVIQIIMCATVTAKSGSNMVLVYPE